MRLRIDPHEIPPRLFEAEQVRVHLEVNHGLDEGEVGLERGLVDADALAGDVLLELVDNGVRDLPAWCDFMDRSRARGGPRVAFLREFLGEADECPAALQQA